MGSVKIFLKERLGLDGAFLSKLWPITIMMICENTQSTDHAKVQNKATVIFQTVEERDSIRSAAVNRAKTAEPCGIRLEIPVALKSNFRVLESTAFRIRKTNPGAKTNVKFHDESLGLVLDFKTRDSDWRSIKP